MSGDTVSSDVLLYVADFLIDELSQNAANASDTKQRLRSYMGNLTSFMGSKRAHAQPEGAKQKDAGESDAEVPDRKRKNQRNGADDEKVRKRPRNLGLNNAFTMYGSHVVPESVKAYRDAHLHKKDTMQFFNKYRRYLPVETLKQFEEDYREVVEEYNKNPDRKKGESAALVARMQDRDKAQGIVIHPAFSSVKEFIDKEAARLGSADAPSIPAGKGKKGDQAIGSAEAAKKKPSALATGKEATPAAKKATPKAGAAPTTTPAAVEESSTGGESTSEEESESD